MLCLLLIAFLFIILTLDCGYCIDSNDPVPFSYDELSCHADIITPAKNLTYLDSDIAVNVSLLVGGTEQQPSTHYIPYQGISCLCSLDGSEWQNMSLVVVDIREPFNSLVNPVWYSTAILNYTTTLHDVSDGMHNLRLDVKPDSIHTSFYIDSDQNYSLNSQRYQDNLNFTIAQNSNNESPPKNTQPYTMLAIPIIVGVIALISVVALKKKILVKKP
jgi:hypothetical protein